MVCLSLSSSAQRDIWANWFQGSHCFAGKPTGKRDQCAANVIFAQKKNPKTKNNLHLENMNQGFTDWALFQANIPQNETLFLFLSALSEHFPVDLSARNECDVDTGHHQSSPLNLNTTDDTVYKLIRSRVGWVLLISPPNWRRRPHTEG